MTRFINLDAAGKELPKGADNVRAVRDTKTRLDWLVGAVECDDHAEAVAKAGEQTLFGEPCRLPTVEELESIRDRSTSRPAADHGYFKWLPTNDWCWSSTAFAGDSDCVWYVNFDYGGSYYGYRYGSGYALAVRAAPSQ